MKTTAEFYIAKETNEYIYIIDTGIDAKSVTNDANSVVAFLTENHRLEQRRLFYRDSMGQIDEIVHENGQFIRFVPGHKGITDELELL
jgi:hypothetical protein